VGGGSTYSVEDRGQRKVPFKFKMSETGILIRILCINFEGTGDLVQFCQNTDISWRREG
jgi:hypothetical protein